MNGISLRVETFLVLKYLLYFIIFAFFFIIEIFALFYPFIFKSILLSQPLRRYQNKNLALSNELIKVELPP